MRARKVGPEHLEPQGPRLPDRWATELAFQHMPCLNWEGKPVPVTSVLIRRKRTSPK